MLAGASGPSWLPAVSVQPAGVVVQLPPSVTIPLKS